jgi:TonB C terminal
MRDEEFSHLSSLNSQQVYFMTSSQTIDTKISGSTRDFRKHWMGYALALSLVLHIGAALAFIIAGGFRIAGEKSPDFIIQEIALAPSLSAPAKTPAPVVPHQAMNSPAPLPDQDANKPVQEPAPEQPSESTGISGKEGGMMSTPLGLGMMHGYFSGLADGRSLRDDVRGYYFEMVEKINREWWDKAGLLKEPLRRDGVFELLVARDGTIVSIRILQGSGSREADRLLTEIIGKASPLPPLPASYDLGLFRAPLRIKAPSFLFRITN